MDSTLLVSDGALRFAPQNKTTAFSNSKGGGLKRLLRHINPSLTC
jgi:hypothetical protein